MGRGDLGDDGQTKAGSDHVAGVLDGVIGGDVDAGVLGARDHVQEYGGQGAGTAAQLQDARLGHVRRYRRRELEADVRAAGFDVVDARYVNLPGWFSWLLLVRLFRHEPMSPSTIRLFDRWIVPVVRWLETHVRVPFGQSVFLIARKPG